MVRGTREPACPDHRALVDFEEGRLTEQDYEEVADHLSSCVLCAGVLTKLRDNPPEHTFVNRIRRCMAIECGEVSEPSYQSMDAAIQALRAGDTAATIHHPEVVRACVPEVTGTVIDRYQILDTIGRGGMGVVYRARHLPIDRVVALKMVLAGIHADRVTLERLYTEGQAVARIRHPNVVQLYDFGNHEGLPYFTMEYVEGETLAARLLRGPLEFREAAELLVCLARAVEAAHRSRVLHRDLKPANILFGADGAPKIADFGLAKLQDVGSSLTVTNMVCGTPSYMAPEQASGQVELVDRHTDVYALGAILYETLAHRPPFNGATKADTLRLVCHMSPPRPSRWRPNTPKDLEAICLKCLEKSPANRYPSAEALADDLARWLRNQRPLHTPGPVRRFLRAARRQKWTALAAALLFGAMAIAVSRDSDRPLRAARAELSGGRPVTLLRDGGEPDWFQWRTGEANGRTSRAKDGSFSVHTWETGLVELVDDPMCDRFQIKGEIRHEKSSSVGGVGFYVARQSYPAGTQPVHFFVQISFDDVRPVAPTPVVVPGNVPPIAKNQVRILPRLLTEDSVLTQFNKRMEGGTGVLFVPAGEGRTGWRVLDLVVGPEGVAGTWDGRPVLLTSADIGESVAKTMAALPPDPSSVRQLRPAYTPRGGLGLLLMRGSASFRSVVVTPLPTG